MFQIKICGITNVDDALAVAQAGADAIGLNFYPQSPRYVSTDAARDIASALPTGVVKVGLFVNTPASDVCRLFDDLQLDLVQLHGDQPPEFLPQLGDRPVMRAFRVGPEGLRPVTDYLARCRELVSVPTLVLLDSLVVGEYGGTGTVANWSAAQEYMALTRISHHPGQTEDTMSGGQAFLPVPKRPEPSDRQECLSSCGEKLGQTDLPALVLAGGLTPQNVAAAIRTVRPAAIDVASGVESRPGRKDPAAVAAFVQAARTAFANV
jgi:phosphoribosylanthranilate isomerase